MRPAGFTLLEIMLVLVLLGVVTAMVIPTLTPADSQSKLRSEADRFAALVRLAHEESLIAGSNLGVAISTDGYRFMRWNEGKWQLSQHDRLLTERELPEAMRLNFEPGESVWQPMLDAEQSAQGESLFDDSETDESDEEEQEPDLYIWSSGEMTAAEVRFESSTDGSRYVAVTISDPGKVVVDDIGEEEP